MTNERIWESLVNFLSSLGGTDPVSMIHETASYMPAVENYLSTLEVNDDIPKVSFYLGVFLGEYINQTYSGYWKHGEQESFVMVGPDEDGLMYQTSENQIAIESMPQVQQVSINPFALAKEYLNSKNEVGLSNYVRSHIQPQA